MTDRLTQALAHAINCHSAENGSNTPDFIIAEYLTDCLRAFDKAVTAREKWYGRDEAARREAEAQKPFPANCPQCGLRHPINRDDPTKIGTVDVNDGGGWPPIDASFASNSPNNLRKTDAPPPPAPHSRKEEPMAEKAKEQVLEELLAIQREWTPAHDANGEPIPLSDGQSIDIGRRYDQARAAVLARMYGPGEVVVPEETLRRIRRTCEISASIMRDGTRTGFWSGAENVARAFDRIRLLAVRPNNGGTDG